MVVVVRVLVGVAGLLALVLAAAFLFDPATAALRFGIAPQEPLGFSTLRADFGGLFGTAGLLAIAAGVRNNARLLTAPLLLIGIALIGRMLTIAVSGYEASMMQPIAVEIVLVSLFAAGRNFLAKA